MGLRNNLAQKYPAGMRWFLNSANFLFQIFNAIGQIQRFSKFPLINTDGSIPALKTLPGKVFPQTLYLAGWVWGPDYIYTVYCHSVSDIIVAQQWQLQFLGDCLSKCQAKHGTCTCIDWTWSDVHVPTFTLPDLIYCLSTQQIICKYIILGP